MSMIYISVNQGDAEWRQFRATHYGASDAPVMMGCSSYKSRNELIAEKATSIAPEPDAAAQARFAEGHRIEALARPIAERVLEAELFPVVGALPHSKISASFDGLTLDEAIAWECKTLNQRLADCMPAGNPREDVVLPEEYRVQMNQQQLVSGAGKTLFTAAKFAADGTPLDVRHCWYERDHELEARILAGWAQFEKDVAAYQPPEPAAPAATGQAPETLPALVVQISGAVQSSNLADFKERALWLIRGVKQSLTTDQDFADAEQTVKWCKEIEDRISATKQAALAQTASIDELFRTMDAIAEEARRVRLALDKQVKAEKQNRKTAIVLEAQKAVLAYMGDLHKRLGRPVLPAPAMNFAAVIKGRSSLANMQSAVDDEVASIKIDLSAQADRAAENMRRLEERAAGKWHLFPDADTLYLLPTDQFENAVVARLAKAAEAERQRLEAERARIEAAAKAKAEAEARAVAEAERAHIRAEEEAKARAAAEAERERIAAEERAKAQAEAALAAAKQEKQDANPVEIRSAARADVGQPDRGSNVVAAGHAPAAGQAVAQQSAVAAPGRSEAQSPGPRETTPALSDKPMLKLGDINKRLAPLSISCIGLAELGAKPLATEKNSKLYSEYQFRRVCEEIHKRMSRLLADIERQHETEVAA